MKRPALREVALVVAALLVGACERTHVAATPVEVRAVASRDAEGVELTLSVGPASTGMDDITYRDARTEGLVVRANGMRIVPGSERFEPTLIGGDVIVRLRVPGDVETLALEGEVVVRDLDGSALERVRVPARVRVAPR